MRDVVIACGLLALPACFESSEPPPFEEPDDPEEEEEEEDEPSIGPCGEERCSPRTPTGLDFLGISSVGPGFPVSGLNRHIAIGGTHEVSLVFGNTDVELSLPYDARTDNPNALLIDRMDGATVTLRGLGGTANLRVVDPATDELYDRAAYVSSPYASAAAVGVEELIASVNWLSGSASVYAFAPGARRIGVAFMNASSNRLVDTSARIELAGATQVRWDTIEHPALTSGVHTIALTVGDTEATVDILVTAAADRIETLFASSGLACFGAYVGDAFISGIPWEFTVDGNAVAGSAFGANCVGGPVGSVVTASAGGQSVTVAVGP